MAVSRQSGSGTMAANPVGSGFGKPLLSTSARLAGLCKPVVIFHLSGSFFRLAVSHQFLAGLRNRPRYFV